ncbi:hypothetical protein C7999DRAFT_34298 [Corynascus novoguineensis]|uniref:Biogenesis of lysosome-related organelles complex 1 subunit 1 n=1 Tax=Corynascus novoguineensis TaxID=1126955 RepID=A0AAN7HH62_9PEZI|nr:hypothetical protein C7999DRAFT_34298 [Corynascus novoguineensis]
MTSLAAPIRLTSASISPAQPLAPSVSNTTVTASSLSSTDDGSRSSDSSRRPSGLFSSLLSNSRATKPRTTEPFSSTPSSVVAAADSSASVSASTSTSSKTAITFPIASNSATTTITTATAIHPPTSAPTTLPSAASQHLPPPPPQPEQVAQARTAVLASIGNLLDRELSTRAALLHANAAAIARQERDVERATAGLRRENDRLGALAETHARRVKEIGNVQNWAEMLEREFVILEETLRLVDEGGSTDEEGSLSGSESGSGNSGSDWEREDGEGGEGSGQERDAEGDTIMRGGPETVSLPASPPGNGV